ncbi:rhomboid-like protein [Cellulomonas sp. URHD0024]|uniref:rhomboid-like protein n=1 Tax=Cellulomonas sp. URHD0024 TaxID=1302620 RepID=UPI0004160540|nr:rhomboid-like protein [Cellulomonas sp. URHD0024]
MTNRPVGALVGRVLRDVWATVRRADLAIAYCAVVTVVTVWVHLQTPERQAEILARVSTNLVSLRAEPVVAMLGSALLVQSVWGLYLVVLLLVVLAYLQQFVGRLASLTIGLVGHVGASLVVALGLAAGIFHGVVDKSVATATDVGVSYVMACAMGFLTLAVPPRWRWWYLAAIAVYWLLPAATPTFTDAGHATSLTLGLLLAFVASRAVAADHRSPAPGPDDVDPLEVH